MSKQKVFSVFDSKAQAFLQPFHTVNPAVAVRMIADATQQKDHMFNTHAPDYTLFEIAEFDDETGLFTPNANHTNLGNLQTFIQPELPNVRN